MGRPQRRPNEKGEYACTNCNFWKPPTGFFKNKSTKSGLQSWCKQCVIDNGKLNYNHRVAELVEENRILRIRVEELEWMISERLTGPDGTRIAAPQRVGRPNRNDGNTTKGTAR
jgi:hypothetical protein